MSKEKDIDNRIKETMEDEPVPEKLEPENIKKMLDENTKPEKVININRKAVRVIASLVACVVLVVGAVKFIPTGKTGLETNTDSVSSSSSEITKANDETQKADNNQKTETLSYYKSAQSYSVIYNTLEDAYKEAKKNNKESFFDGIFGTKTDGVSSSTNDMAVAEDTTETGDNKGSFDENGDFSTTDLQVEGVDEADIIKSDGKNIFYVLNGTIYSVQPDADGKFSNIHSESVIDGCYFDEDRYQLTDGNGTYIDTWSTEMYLKDGKICVVSSCMKYIMDANENYIDKDEQTTVSVFSVSEDGSLTREHTYSQEGIYGDSRMIDGMLYINTSYSSMNIDKVEDESQLEKYIPTYSCDGEVTTLPADCIYIPENWQPDYWGQEFTVISGVDIFASGEPVSVISFAGGYGEMYSSRDNIYMAVCETEYDDETKTGKDFTEITRLSLDNGNVAISGSARVDGYVNNQFSMDEYDGYFRIATTSYTYMNNYYSEENNIMVDDIWVDRNESNNLFVFDENLQQIGSITGFAEDESIRSVRFSGNLAYVVTFEQTDPLFAIDLTDPTAPKIISEIKADGYSTYMKKWKDDKLFGFGVDTMVDYENGDSVVQTGVKMSMFTVLEGGSVIEDCWQSLNVNEMECDWIYSLATSDHKALIVDGEKNIIGFPLNRYTNNYENSYAEYYLYSYDGQLNEIGHISYENTDYGQEAFSRAVYIGDNIYIFSDKRIVSAKLSDMSVNDEFNL